MLHFSNFTLTLPELILFVFNCVCSGKCTFLPKTFSRHFETRAFCLSKKNGNADLAGDLAPTAKKMLPGEARVECRREDFAAKKK